MAWRVAKSLNVLLDQINRLSPNRSKASDGTIGDPRHQANPSSDHNPHVVYKGVGIVTAMDITNDPAHGIDSEKLANALLASRDPRIKYVISNKKIASGTKQNYPAWSWRPYSGKNPHDHHCHLSVKPDPKLFDDTTPWNIKIDIDLRAIASEPSKDDLPVLRRGDKEAVSLKSGPIHHLQALLNGKKVSGNPLKVDGDFGSKTDKVVRAYQASANLVVDGVVGGATWRSLKGR